MPRTKRTPEEKRAQRAKDQRNYLARHKDNPVVQARIKADYARWRVANLEKLRERDRARAIKKRLAKKATPEGRIEKSVRARLYSEARLLRAPRAGSRPGSMSLAGCTMAELRAHLERQLKPGMTWENYGREGWHIDHIRPCSSFNLQEPAELAECFHFTNLQPLWWWENLRKGDRLVA